MPQGRIILKSICQSKKLATIKSDGARLLYTWLIPNLDVNGYFSADPKVIKGQIFTRLKKTNKVISKYLEELQSVGLIVIYEAKGDVYLCVPDFVEKQPNLNPQREGKSNIPPPTPDQLQSKSGVTPTQVKESKVKQKESKYAEEFDQFWKEYPRKEAKQRAIDWFRKTNLSEEDVQKMIYTIRKQNHKGGRLYWGKDHREYVPLPATWLNDGDWRDAPTEADVEKQVEEAAAKEQQTLEKKKQEIRSEYSGYYQVQTKEQLQEMSKANACITHRWLIKEILAKRKDK